MPCASQKEEAMKTKAAFWHRESSGLIQCDLCPHACKLRAHQKGVCGVRGAEGEEMVLYHYGRISGLALDPIEKKPLYHFLPGSSILSFGTEGCNLSCSFCQNWQLTKVEHGAGFGEIVTAREIVEAARQSAIPSIAFTYNDPVVFAEFALEVAQLAEEAGIHTCAVTAGYMQSQARAEFYRHINAANVDLKSFRDEFYRRNCKGSLAPVLDTLSYLKHDTKVWLEITNLILPGENDRPDEIRELARFVARELGVETPLHFSAFHPDYKMLEKDPTSLEILLTARRIAQEEGVLHVYLGNVRSQDGATTFCSGCGARLIERQGYRTRIDQLTAAGECRSCGTRLAGYFNSSAA
jgi:pyruvate formate lyase activating enzyme